jgi:hypothetical protein
MTEETADTDGCRDSGPRLGSAGAALVSLGLASGLVGLVLEVLHPGVLAMAVGTPTLCALIPGWVIGLLDRERPATTALTASAVFGVGLLAILCGFRFGGYAGPGAMWLFVPIASLFAVLGAKAGQLTRRSPRGVAIGSLALVLAFVGVFIAPEAAYRRAADRFLAQRGGDLKAFVSRDLVRVPTAGLEWHTSLTRGLFRGVELSATWRATTRSVGPGQCSLTVRTDSLPLTGDLHDYVEAEDFSFAPDRPARLRTLAEAQALLRELGVREPPEGLQGRTSLTWTANWRRDRRHRGAAAYYSLRVDYSGVVTATRSSPLTD